MLHRYFWSVHLNLNPISGIIKLYKKFMKQLQKINFGICTVWQLLNPPKKVQSWNIQSTGGQAIRSNLLIPFVSDFMPPSWQAMDPRKAPQEIGGRIVQGLLTTISGKIDVSWVMWHLGGSPVSKAFKRFSSSKVGLVC